MLSSSKLPSVSENETIYDLYTQICDQLYVSGLPNSAQGCVFVGEVSALMDILDTLQPQHNIVLETWLSFLPICFKHGQCIFCLQEADEEETRGIRTLRNKIIRSADSLIASLYRRTTSGGDFVPPIIASSQAFVAGCSLAVATSKKWTSLDAHARAFLQSTEILATFAPHWKGGDGYLKVWRAIVQIVYSSAANIG